MAAGVLIGLPHEVNMNEPKPVVYVLHGEDEFAIAQVIAKMEQEMGDPAVAAMNTSRLDGRSLSLDELQTTASALPFMGERRLVVVTNWVNTIITPDQQAKTIKVLENLPSTTRLVLVENKTLVDKSSKPWESKPHWLVVWTKQIPQYAYEKHFALLTGRDLANWIQKQAGNLGGIFTPGAAELLAGLAGDDPRMAQQEINKLLAYVNYRRPVEIEDVQEVTPDVSLVENFALVNALRKRDLHQALKVLCKELEETDAYLLVSRIARQFSTLLCARDVLDRGGNIKNIANELKIKENYAKHLYDHALKLSSDELETVHHRLLEIDEAIKTGQIDGDIALECFVADYITK